MTTQRWTTKTPAKAGYYWYRQNEGSDPSIVRLVRVADETELTIQYRDLDVDPEDEDASVDWLPNWNGEWCFIPIPI